MVTAFERLLVRLDDLQLDPGRPVKRNHGLLFYSFKALPIQFTGVTPRTVRPD
jgi:hypothetical protein